MTFHRPPVTVCPNCQAAIPAALQHPAEETLSRQAAPRPALLTIGMYVAPMFGIICLLAVLAAAANVGFVTFTVNGEAVSGHEFLSRAGLAFAVLGALALGIAYGIWQDRSWTRWLILGFWATLVALDVGLGWASAGAGGAASGIAGMAVFVLVVGWYVLGKDNVVQYYRALEASEAARAGAKAKGGA